MARVNVPVTTSTVGGATLPAATAGDATNFNTYANSGREKVIVKNTGATPRVLTILFNKTVQGQTITSLTPSIAAGAEVIFGPYPVEDFGTQVQLNPAHAELTFRVIA